MAKRTRAPARRGRTTQSTHFTQTRKKNRNKTAEKPKRKTTQKSAVAQTRQASLARRRIYTPELLAYVRQRFEQTRDSMADIGLDLGISKRNRQAPWHARAMETLRAAAAWAATCSETCRAQARHTGSSQQEQPSTAQSTAWPCCRKPKGEGDIPPLAGY